MATVIQTNFASFVPFAQYHDPDHPLPCEIDRHTESFGRVDGDRVIVYSISHMMPVPGLNRDSRVELFREFIDAMTRNVMYDFRRHYSQRESEVVWDIVQDEVEMWDDLELTPNGNNLAVILKVAHIGMNHFDAMLKAVENEVHDRLTARMEQIAGRTIGKAFKNPTVGLREPCPCGSGKRYKNCCRKKGAVTMKLTDQANYIPANTRTIETPDGATIHFVQGPVEHHPIPEITLRGNITGMATHPEWRRMSKAEKITFVKGALGDRHALKVRNGVTLYFLTPDFVQEALKLNTDAERLAFINANVIVVDPGEPLDLEIR